MTERDLLIAVARAAKASSRIYDDDAILTGFTEAMVAQRTALAALPPDLLAEKGTT